MGKKIRGIAVFFTLMFMVTAMFPLSAFAAPDTEERVVIYVKVPAEWENPCVWAWDEDGNNAFEAWPGKGMTADENGWYTAKAPIWVNSIIINGNEGSVQTADISIDPAELWVTVEADGTFDFSYTDPEKAEIPNVSVYVKAPSDWETPCLWAWSAPDGTNVYSTWPGEAFEEEENGWLKKEVPGWVNSVIVNGNEGSVQTTDISVESGKDLWLVVNGPEDYMVYYEEPAADETAQTAETAENVEESTETLAEENTENSEGSNMIIWIIGGVVVVAAVATGIVVKNKKKTAA